MLTPEQIQSASVAVREFRIALSNFFLYDPENAMVQQSMERFLKIVEELLQSLPSVSFGESEGRLVIEGMPLDEKFTGSTAMIKELFINHKIHSMTFLGGVRLEEMKAFFGLLKPKALPPGTTLFQALGQNSVEHIKLNEKVFVAVKEGEKLISVGSEMEGEENIQESLDALQSFLQIFGKVKSGDKKHEVARKMIDNMGGWLADEVDATRKEGGLGPGSGPGGGSGGGSGNNAAQWGQLLNAFLSLKNTLASVKQPEQLENVHLNMDDFMKKLLYLAEGQGVRLSGGGSGGAGEGDLFAESSESEADQNALFETDPILSAFELGDFSPLVDPRKEAPVDQRLAQLQEPEKADFFETVWDNLWKKVFSGDEATQTLCLRHISRLQWNKLPRPSQLEGFRNLRKLLIGQTNPALFRLGLSLLKIWLPLELPHPHWAELEETVSALKGLSTQSPPLFEKQEAEAQAALNALFPKAQFDDYFSRTLEDPKDQESLERIFLALSAGTGPFLMQKAIHEEMGSPDWKKAVDWINRMEAGGVPVYEQWLKENPGPEKLDPFLEIFRKVLPPPAVTAYLEKNWNILSPEARSKIMEIIEFWEKPVFRPILTAALNSSEHGTALKALKIFAKMGRDEDARNIVTAVKNYPAESKDKEEFWIEACEALGKIHEPYSINFLVEWASNYKFLESRKERSLELRKSAIKALGHFRSQYVQKFLTELLKGTEKELKPDISESIKSVEEKLSDKDKNPEQPGK